MNPTTTNTPIHILQPRTIVGKSIMSHVAVFMHLVLIKDSASKLKFC